MRFLLDERAETDAVVALPAVVAVMVAIAFGLGIIAWWAAARSTQAIADEAAFQALSIPVLGRGDANQALTQAVATDAATRSFPPLSCSLLGTDLSTSVPHTLTVAVRCQTTVPILDTVSFERAVSVTPNPSHLVASQGGES